MIEAVLAIASVVVISWAIADLYHRSSATNKQVCAVSDYQWRAIKALYEKTGHTEPGIPPPCILPK